MIYSLSEFRGRSRWSGFTLIECLAVIVIVGILMLIVIPGINRIRNISDGAKCSSNLRQIGIAYQLYAQGNVGLLPDKSGYSTAFKAIKHVAYVTLDPYIPAPLYDDVANASLEGVWRCPSGPEDWTVTYSPNNYIWGLNLNRVIEPGRFAIMWDRGGTADSPPGTQSPGVGWHQDDLYNTLYADGHVNGVSLTKLREQMVPILD